MTILFRNLYSEKLNVAQMSAQHILTHSGNHDIFKDALEEHTKSEDVSVSPYRTDLEDISTVWSAAPHIQQRVCSLLNKGAIITSSKQIKSTESKAHQAIVAGEHSIYIYRRSNEGLSNLFVEVIQRTKDEHIILVLDNVRDNSNNPLNGFGMVEDIRSAIMCSDNQTDIPSLFSNILDTSDMLIGSYDTNLFLGNLNITSGVFDYISTSSFPPLAIKHDGTNIPIERSYLPVPIYIDPIFKKVSTQLDGENIYLIYNWYFETHQRSIINNIFPVAREKLFDRSTEYLDSLYDVENHRQKPEMGQCPEFCVNS